MAGLRKFRVRKGTEACRNQFVAGTHIQSLEARMREVACLNEEYEKVFSPIGVLTEGESGEPGESWGFRWKGNRKGEEDIWVDEIVD